jgi:ABC-2 type transport system ATP-binding protein
MTTPEECARELLETVPTIMQDIKTQMRSHRTPDLTIPQFRTLVYADRNPGTSLSDLAEHLGLTLPSTSKLVDDLLKRGFITREEHPIDRRRLKLALTVRGIEILDASRTATLAYFAKKLVNTSASDRAAIIQAMNTMHLVLQTNKSEHTLTNVIETNNLTRAYNGFKAVDNLNITVESGEIFGLLGPNGAGKTTTISMLCTILKPTSGTAKVNGYDVVKEAMQVRKSIGIVFQDPSIDDRLSARENLYMHANLYGVPASEQKSRIDRILKLVELEDRADDLLRTYSGGMRRRLELGRGLIHYPKVLFLDEPTVGLDPQTRDHIWTYIKELKEAHDITVVLTTHYMDEADRLSDHIGIIDHGKLIKLDTPVKLKEPLEGDVVIIKADRIDELTALLAEKLGLTKCQIMDGALEVTVKGGKNVMPRIMEVAAQNKFFVVSIQLREPNLEDVFLHYTGRDIRADSTKELHGVAAIHRRKIR